VGRTFGKGLELAAAALASLFIATSATAQFVDGRQPPGKPVTIVRPLSDRAKLVAFQSGLTAAAGQLAAADKAYLAAVRAALRGGVLADADLALARYDQQVTLAVRAAPPTPAFGGCAAAARAGADKAHGMVVQAATGRRQRVQHLRQLGAARGLSIADYFSVSPQGGAEPAAGIKSGIAEASAALSHCERAQRPKPAPRPVPKRPKPAALSDAPLSSLAPPPGRGDGSSATPR
jgi:hypothetical protein